MTGSENQWLTDGKFEQHLLTTNCNNWLNNILIFIWWTIYILHKQRFLDVAQSRYQLPILNFPTQCPYGVQFERGIHPVTTNQATRPLYRRTWYVRLRQGQFYILLLIKIFCHILPIQKINMPWQKRKVFLDNKSKDIFQYKGFQHKHFQIPNRNSRPEVFCKALCPVEAIEPTAILKKRWK